MKTNKPLPSVLTTTNSMLHGIHTDDVFLWKRENVWRVSSWKINPESKRNLEESIKRFKNKFGGK